MREEFGVPRTKEEKIESLIHLYVDGGLNRRDLIRRLSRLAGGAAGAAVILSDAGLAQQPPPVNAADLRVAEDDAAILWRNVTYPGQAGPLQGLLAYPRPFSGGRRLRSNDTPGPDPAILVIHENRGLVEHIRDVTRRFAKAGYVALGIDFLSRQGGTGAFETDTTRAQAYGRTVESERLQDMVSSVDYLKTLDELVVPDRIGAVGYCAGGGNIFFGIYNGLPLQSAVPYYGTPPNPLPATTVTTPTLAIFSETDRNQAARIPGLAESFVNSRISFGIQVYKGSGHGFFNDTGNAFNRPAAEDAWRRTIDFLNTHLRAPRTA